MEKRLNSLLKEIDTIINMAPAVDDCSDADNRIYSEMANLKAALVDAGYDNAFFAEKKAASKKIFGISIVNSGGYSDGKESRVFFGYDKDKLIAEIYDRYCNTWTELSENGDIRNGMDQFGQFKADFESFKCNLLDDGYEIIQLDDYHLQYEFFETEMFV